jgi:hypothetical protein
MDELVLEGVKIEPHPLGKGLCLVIPMGEVVDGLDPDAGTRLVVIEKGCGWAGVLVDP